MDESPNPSLPNERRRILAELLTRSSLETRSEIEAFNSVSRREYDELLEKRRRAEDRPVGSKAGSLSKKKTKRAGLKKKKRTIHVRGGAKRATSG